MVLNTCPHSEARKCSGPLDCELRGSVQLVSQRTPTKWVKRKKNPVLFKTTSEHRKKGKPPNSFSGVVTIPVPTPTRAACTYIRENYGPFLLINIKAKTLNTLLVRRILYCGNMKFTPRMSNNLETEIFFISKSLNWKKYNHLYRFKKGIYWNTTTIIDKNTQ